MRTVVPGPCPYCNTEIEYLYQTENIPYFSDILIISAICPACGYRYVDTQLLKNADPTRYELAVETRDDLDVRVVRSMTAHLEVPELGVRIDPGPACEGFVSNVEGVLDRIAQAIHAGIRDGDETEKENGRVLLERIASIKAGKLPMTLILQDPMGNSMIVSDKAVKKPVAEDEPEECEP
ncbi:ZPR1-related zinc finger protein [Methanoregula boonei 6A8]|uniref:ZPR1-related zinc finger protein n=1 Tax=Methanoregula boonei (strain DSM 21154 / JCM 14090 / 6A8) TaxID=456442 RepID=A7I4F3_METB6|nr:ZPR1 zinc finger domain-containing protein [Methanoregula boonei]ABS54614.1 ZPR1-related zinc finger protein [Methanoregula boonei 6A8]